MLEYPADGCFFEGGDGMKQGTLYFVLLVILLLFASRLFPEYVQIDGLLPLIVAVISLLLLDFMIAFMGLATIAWVGVGRWSIKVFIIVAILLKAIVFVANMVALNVMNSNLGGFYIPNVWIRVLIALVGVPSININTNRE